MVGDGGGPEGGEGGELFVGEGCGRAAGAVNVQVDAGQGVAGAEGVGGGAGSAGVGEGFAQVELVSGQE